MVLFSKVLGLLTNFYQLTLEYFLFEIQKGGTDSVNNPFNKNLQLLAELCRFKMKASFQDRLLRVDLS